MTTKLYSKLVALALCCTTSLLSYAQPVISYTVSDYNGYQVSCASAIDGSISVTTSGTTGTVNHTWFGPSGFSGVNPNITGLAAGSYIIQVSDDNGTSTDTIVLLAPPALQLTASISNKAGFGVSCFGGSDGDIDISVLGGAGSNTFSWIGPTGTYTSEDLINFPAGNYSVVVSDTNGCSASGSYTLSEPSPNTTNFNLSNFIGGFHVSCADATDGKIDLTPGGGASPHTFNWSGPNNFSSTAAHFSNAAAGTYFLTMSDANGCTLTDSVELIAPAPLNVSLTGPTSMSGYHFICAGDSNGFVNTNISGGMPTYAYSWSSSTGENYSSKDLSALQAATYTVQVSDTNGCSASESITLNQPDPIAITSSVSNYSGFEVSCGANDGSIDISSTGGVGNHSYYWIGPGAVNFTTSNISTLTAGSYTLGINDILGCAFDTTFVLEQPESIDTELITSQYLSVNVSCNGAADGSIDLNILNALSNPTVAWTGPAGFTSSSQNLSSLEAGSYSVTVSHPNACTWDSTIVLTEPNPFNVVLNAPSTNGFNIACNGQNSGDIQVTLIGGLGDITHSWSGPNGFSSPSLDLTSVLAGTYTFDAVDKNGCSVNESITLTQPDSALSASLTPSVQTNGYNVSCDDATDADVDLDVLGGTGPFTVQWNLANGTTTNTQNLVAQGAGTHQVMISDANGCTYSSSVSLTAPAPISILNMTLSQYGSDNLSCSESSDGAITPSFVGGTGPYSLTWNGPNAFSSNATNPSGLVAGVYHYTATDQMGCQYADSVEITAPQPLNAGLGASLLNGFHISCEGFDDGSITSSPSGGNGQYSYNWSGPNSFSASTSQVNNLAPGQYCISVSDSNNCVINECITLIEPSEVDVSSMTVDALCGDNNGSVDLTVVGGVGPYDFTWTTGSTSEDLNNVVTGTYSVSISDANGCTTIHDATVNGGAGLNLQANIVGSSCNGSEDGSIDLDVVTGNGGYSYSWSNGSSAQDQSGLTAGTYTVIVSDSDGCEASESFTVPEPAALSVELLLSDHAGFNVSGYQMADGTASAVISGGSPPYSATWSNGFIGNQSSGLSAGEYMVSVTDANGCSTTLPFEITEPFLLAMPNGFSPNGDGRNDAFVIKGIELYPENELVVLNRWGDVVYERKNYRNEWTGENRRGTDLDDGTYFVLFRIPANEIEMTGYVELRR